MRRHALSPSFAHGRRGEEALEAGVRFATGSDSHWLERSGEITLVLRYVEEYRIPGDRFFLPQRVIEPPAPGV